MDIGLVKNLEQIGLTNKQALAYMALLRLNSSNAATIAKESGLERTSIYKVLKELEDEGLVIFSKHGSRMTYSAEPPAKLSERVARSQAVLSDIFPLLTALQGNKGYRPAVKLYESIEGIKQVYNDSLNAEEKLRRDFMSIESMSELLGTRFIQNHIDKRVKKNIHVKSLRCNTDKQSKDWYLKHDNTELNREVRLLDKSLQFAPLIMIYDNKVVVITSKKELLALVVESNELSGAMKIFFDIAWASSVTNKDSIQMSGGIGSQHTDILCQ